jgi:hypothetical protein
MTLTTDTEEIPVRIVGSSVFGRYPTISVERTYNLFITSSGDGEEEWLANFPGFAVIMQMFNYNLEGRGAFHSVRGGFIIVVVSGAVFRINSFSELPIQIGTISSTTGEVVMDENLSSQIAIVAGGIMYIYNYAEAANAIFPAIYNDVPADTEFEPNYVSYHNTYFLVGNALSTASGSQWVIFQQNTTVGAYNLEWVQTLALQTKPDFARAILRIPGKGNNVIVFGSTVAEIWNNVGGLEVYQRYSGINIDFGAASVSTIASNEEVVAWLGINEKSSPALMAMQGGSASRISTDGLDYLLSTVNFPSKSTAILFRQDGHNFYVLTFLDPSDNFSIMYDFTTKRLFDVTDWDFTAFPARQIIYFNNLTYFINYKDGKMYEISTNITTYNFYNNSNVSLPLLDYDIPQIRVTNTHRLPRPEKYKISLFTFVMESGTTPNTSNIPVCFGYLLTELINDPSNVIIYTEDGLPILGEGGYCYINTPRVDLTISKNGGNTFSNTVPYQLKPTGDFRNMPRFINLGFTQQITYQLRFWGAGRKVIKNGVMEVGT